jgi:hypothetical protein
LYKGDDLLPAGTEDFRHIIKNTTEKQAEDPDHCSRDY